MTKIKVISCKNNCQITEEAIKLAGLEISKYDKYDCLYMGSVNPILATGSPAIIDFDDFENEVEVSKIKEALSLYSNIELVRVPSLECKTLLVSENIENNRKIVVRPFGYDAGMFNITKRTNNPKLRIGTVGPAWGIVNSLSPEILQDIEVVYIGTAPVNYFSLDIIVSYSETFRPWNPSVLQAMACGAFPIISNTEGIKMILHNDGIGNVCSPDSDSIKQNILMAYTSWKQSPDFLLNLGRRASKTARKYNWNKFVDLLVDDLAYLKEQS